MTHELLHVVLPSLARQHMWLSEGIPSYVEPIARVRAGLTTPEAVWRDLMVGLPQGLPEAGDQGLERTHTWGRTYWGGSLFCLLADVRIREATGDARSFDDVIRAVVATGADVEAHWEVTRLLDVGDGVTGTGVLHALYRELALAPGAVDLPALWRRLGLRLDGDRLTFDDAAPLASVRRGIAGR
jgi:predicted metalloprotease with PDZ domain